MTDFQKIFALLKDKNDDQALAELQSHFQPPFDHKAFIDAAYVPSNSSTQHNFGGFGGHSASCVKGDSLFIMAVTYGRLHCAGLILSTLGIEILERKNDNDENGYLAVAKCNNAEFRRWFLNESSARNISRLVGNQEKPINQISIKHESVLTVVAANPQQAEELEGWLNMGADPSVQDEKGLNALHHACRANAPDAVRLILQRYPKLKDARTEEGETPLHYAAKANKPDALNFLLHQGCAVGSYNKHLCRPLHIALENGCVEGVRALLTHSPMIADESGELKPHANLLDGHFDSPLHILIRSQAKYGNNEFKVALLCLFAQSADPFIRDVDGKTALALARQYLRDDKKEIFWNAHEDRVISPLFTLSTLVQCLQGFLNAEQIHMLREHLKGKLSQVSDNAISELSYVVTKDLKSKINAKYPHHPMLAQAICAVIDDVNQPQHSPQQPRPDMSVLRHLLEGPVSQQPDPNANQAVVARPGGGGGFH